MIRAPVGRPAARVIKLLFWFEDYALDTNRRELRRGSELLPVEPQVFDLLVFLIRNRDRVVSKDDLLASVWGGRIVSESTLTSRVNAARRIIGDTGEHQRLIRTTIGKGVRFVGAVREQQDPTQPLSFAPRLSIVVLPFTNLSDDREQQYFADGITEDLTTDLSRLANMFVISRNTAFTYRNKLIDTRQIGHELGVRYVLEGSVRRSGDLVRVSAQLIDAATDAHLWAERFDRDTADLFALQNEITTRIAIALSLELIAAEAARRTECPDVLEYILRSRAAGAGPPTRTNLAESIGWLERALALDPGSTEAQSRLAANLAGRVLANMTDSAAADIERAKGLAEQALVASPHSTLAHYAKGQVLRAQRRYAEAIPEYETVLASNRNWVYGFFALGQCRLYTGSIEETIPLVEQAIRLGPRDPALGIWYETIGLVHLLQSRIEEAIIWLERARSANPEHPSPHARLASAHALKGGTEYAASELAEARRLAGDDRFSSLGRLKAALGHWGVPSIQALFEATYFAGLRKAGMPEE